MTSKFELIKEVYANNNLGYNKKIVVFAKGFKAVGEYYDNHELKDIVTVKNAKVYSFASSCECDTNPATKEIPWLNVFTEDITAFSFIE